MKATRIKKDAFKIDQIAVRREPDTTAKLKDVPAVRPRKRMRTRVLFGLCAVAVLVVLAWLWLVSFRQAALRDKVAEGSFATVSFRQRDVCRLAAPMLANTDVLAQEFVSRVQRYLADAGLSFQEDIQPLFKQEASISFFEEQGSAVSFILLAQKQSPSAQLKQAIDALRVSLEQDYDFVSQPYRQNEVFSIKSVRGEQRRYFFAQAADYFIFTDSEIRLKKAADWIIEQ